LPFHEKKKFKFLVALKKTKRIEFLVSNNVDYEEMAGKGGGRNRGRRCAVVAFFKSTLEGRKLKTILRFLSSRVKILILLAQDHPDRLHTWRRHWRTWVKRLSDLLGVLVLLLLLLLLLLPS